MISQRKYYGTSRAVLESLEGRRMLAGHVWTGAVDGNWSNAGNWEGGAPAMGESAVELTFPAGSARTAVSNDIGDLTINTLRLGQGVWQLEGGAFSLNGSIFAELEQGSQQISNPINLAGDLRIETSGASSIDGLALIFNGVISGNGGIIKSGHNVRLVADNTYAGATRVESGAISINGDQPQSAVVVDSGEVSGRGAVGGVTFSDQFGSLGAPVQPSIGLLFDGLPEVNGNLTLTSASYLRPMLGEAGGTQVVKGTVTLGGATLSAKYTQIPAVGATFILLDNDGSDAINGTFAGLAEGATFTILDKDVIISYVGGDGNDVAVTVAGSALATRTALAVSANVVEPGRGVTLSAEVTASNTPGVTPTGTVKFYRDGGLLGEIALDGQGRAAIAINNLPLRGSTVFTAVYDGDANQAFLGSRSEEERVRVILAGQTETQVFVSPPSGFAGEGAVVVARVVGLGIPAGTPTETVELFVGEQSIGRVMLDGSGRAEVPTDQFPIGQVDIRAVYGGDDNFTASTGFATRLTRLIQGRYFPTTTMLDVSAGRSHAGQPITLSVTVAKLPGIYDVPYDGYVNFYDGSTKLGTAAVNTAGRATLMVDDLPVGAHALAARYVGSRYYLTSASGVQAHNVTTGPGFELLGSSTHQLAVVVDVDRDGDSDLVYRDSATGENTIQFLSSNGAVERTVALPTVADADWKLEGAGVFNGQNQTDLLWRNETSGSVLLWRIDGGRLAGINTLATSPSNQWRIAGTGDIDADGQEDIVWRNDTTGQAVVWFMRGRGVREVTGLGPVARNLNWRLDAAGDVNGDGRADLLWVNQQTHAVAVWLMRGTAFLSFRQLGRVDGPGWEITGVADLDGDGGKEIIFRNADSAQLQTWAADVR